MPFEIGEIVVFNPLVLSSSYQFCFPGLAIQMVKHLEELVNGSEHCNHNGVSRISDNLQAESRKLKPPSLTADCCKSLILHHDLTNPNTISLITSNTGGRFYDLETPIRLGRMSSIEGRDNISKGRESWGACSSSCYRISRRFN